MLVKSVQFKPFQVKIPRKSKQLKYWNLRGTFLCLIRFTKNTRLHHAMNVTGLENKSKKVSKQVWKQANEKSKQAYEQVFK